MNFREINSLPKNLRSTSKSLRRFSGGQTHRGNLSKFSGTKGIDSRNRASRNQDPYPGGLCVSQKFGMVQQSRATQEQGIPFRSDAPAENLRNDRCTCRFDYELCSIDNFSNT